MPFPKAEVFGSTIGDHTHHGPNQAGNKSLLSWRADYGVPGYTGFIPSNGSVVLPVKGAQHTGRPASTLAVTQLTTKTVEPKKVTEYGAEYKLTPDETKVFSKTGGGYWITDRKQPENVAFLGKSTYQTEVLSGSETKGKQLERVEGLVCTLAGYEAARQGNEVRRSQSVDPAAMRRDTKSLASTSSASIALGNTIPRTAGLAANLVSGTINGTLTGTQSMCPPPAAAAAYSPDLERPLTMPSSYGELPGYQTTYNSMTDRTARMLEESLGTRRPHTAGGDPRFTTLPRVMVPGMADAHSTYRRDFGDESSDPMTRQADTKLTMTRGSTTKDLAEGTSRNVSHIPRYTGHIPASRYASAQAVEQGEAVLPRPDHKANCLLYGMDQYSRGRVPGDTTYKPQAACNVTSQMPVGGATNRSTSGDAAIRGMRFGVPAIDNTHYINSRAGLMTFFNGSTNGTEFVSDNGLFNAQVFYKLTRPLEGAIKPAKPSAQTYYGAKFNPAASMV